MTPGPAPVPPLSASRHPSPHTANHPTSPSPRRIASSGYRGQPGLASPAASPWSHLRRCSTVGTARVMSTIIHGDNLQVLPTLEDGSFELIYIDPPFNTGRAQRHTRMEVQRDEQGDRVGFAGRRYRSTKLGSLSFDDVFDDFLAFIEPRLRHAHRLLSPHGSFFLHIDYREAHYCKVLLDSIFGRQCFLNEIIWAYDYGGRPKRRWPAKHDTLLWYARDPKRYTFNYDAIDRIPYMAPRLVSAEKAARGKTPTDVWWQTIVPTAGRERTGYPTQKPLKILERIVAVHSNPDDRVLDFFAGSGTAGEAAARAGRQFVLVDSSPEAIEVMTQRLAFADPVVERLDPAPASTSEPASDAATPVVEPPAEPASDAAPPGVEPPAEPTSASEPASDAATPAVDLPAASEPACSAEAGPSSETAGPTEPE